MIGLIFKIGAFFAALILGILLLLNITNAWNPGTLSLTAPDRAICQRYALANFPKREIQLMEVRWIATAENYGWGCYYEFGNFDVMTVTPMPEI
jgi:hypothetical protein